MNADLALAVSTSDDNLNDDMFRQFAKYVWEIDEPSAHDYTQYFNEISLACFNHTFNDTYARIVGSVNNDTGGWLGCIKGANHDSCTGQQIFFRYFTLQKILNEKLYETYDKVVITRSDFLWLRSHANISSIKFRELWVRFCNSATEFVVKVLSICCFFK